MTELRVLSSRNQILQYFTLRICWMLHPALDAPHTHARQS
jgi:hypothetical protein